MGTFSETVFRVADIEPVLTGLKKYICTGREVWQDSRKDWFYAFPHDDNSSEEKNGTLIISKNMSKNWVEVDFDFNGNLYVYDEILRRISGTLNTDILMGYYQSTSNEGRLAKFSNGQLELSYFERYFEYRPILGELDYESKVYVADNFGVQHAKIDHLRHKKQGEDASFIGVESRYEFFESEGWAADLGKRFEDLCYLHVEIVM